MSEFQAADTVLTLANVLESRGEHGASMWLRWQNVTIERLSYQLAALTKEREETL